MANIVYGVHGEGSGHSTRSREVIAHLLSRGHKVHVASFDRGLRNLQDEFEVTKIGGLFEPISCHLGHKLRLPIIAIDNQHVLTHAEIRDRPQQRREAAAATMVTRGMNATAKAS